MHIRKSKHYYFIEGEELVFPCCTDEVDQPQRAGNELPTLRM